MNYDQRKLIVVVPLNKDTRSNMKVIIGSLEKCEGLDKCHFVVACCDRDEKLAYNFATQIAECGNTSASVSVVNADYDFDIGSISHVVTFRKKHKEFSEATKMFKGTSKNGTLSEADYKTKIAAYREAERSIRSLLNKAGYFSFQLYKGVVSDLWGWSDYDVEEAGFNPRESIVYLMSEDGLQNPRDPNFFEKMEFEKMKSTYEFLASSMVTYEKEDSRYMNCPMVLGGICGSLKDMYYLFYSVSASYTQNWRRELSGNLVGRCNVSDVMNSNFYKNKKNTSISKGISIDNYFHEKQNDGYVGIFDTDGSEEGNSRMINMIKNRIEERDKSAYAVAEEDAMSMDSMLTSQKKKIIRKGQDESKQQPSAKKITIRRKP